jgi:predicted phage terminase large subunit-like protein
LRRLHPAFFAHGLQPTFDLPRHLVAHSRLLRQVIFGGGGFVLCMMPPRHGKSTLTSLWTPLWYLDLHPAKNVILVSHTARYAETWGRRARDRAIRYEHRFLMRLDPNATKASEWRTTHGGGMVSLGVGGPVTGRGGDLIVLDDPVKDAIQANSPIWRERMWEWWQETIFTRREPGATVVAILTRWHEDDFGGRILGSSEAREWHVLRLPAVAEEGDALGRAVGEPLWGARFPSEELERIRRHVGAYAWEALYQQRPAPPKGAMFWRDRLGTWTDAVDAWELSSGRRIPKRAAWIGQTCDTAMRESDAANWTVVLTFACGPRGEILVLDVVRARLEVPDQFDFVRAAREKWRRHVGYRWLGVENKASGAGILELGRRSGMPLRELDAVADKVTRASTASTVCANGLLFLPREAAWLPAFLQELLAFPRGTHDDQVDCLAYAALQALAQRERLGDEPGREPAEEEERPDDPFNRLAGGGFDDRLAGGF